jgi:hypothetical protein
VNTWIPVAFELLSELVQLHQAHQESGTPFPADQVTARLLQALAPLYPPVNAHPLVPPAPGS